MCKDIISGGFLFLLSIFLITQSIKMSLREDLGPGPGMLPFLLGLLLGILSIILVIKGILRRNVEEEIHLSKKFKFLLYVLLIFFYSLSFKPLGFLISTALFFIIVIHFVEKLPWKTTIWVSVVSVIISYFTFYSLLKIPLPRGVFAF